MMRTSVAFILFTLLLLAGAIAHLSIGARVIAPRTVVDAFFHFDPRNFEHSVIVRLRLMRLCAALVTGAALGVAGVLLQSVIRNPLGEPHILGLNAGAALAVVLTSALGLSLPFGRPLIAAAGAAALFLLVLTFSSSGRTGLTPMKVTLCGVAMSAFASSITATVLILDEQTLLAMRTWLAGDVAGVIGETTASAAGGAAAVGFALALWLSPSLNMLALGDRMAQGLGVSLLKTRLLALLAIALLCGAAVSVAGPIGFIGLVVPQLIRRLVSVDLRVMVPLSALCGALVLLMADIAARTLFTPYELATGVMTALVGAPVFILMASRMFK
ncbi:heme ABC transporter [Enterobacter hormaechei subsp. hoffmannii]|uniref:FecCD family ABC transporter permease n=10 Tax=Gammaproteobacteria TaxID=1236 RepID=UPI0007358FFA|nr:iron ABC transporter permease [Enterobacter hormaechei]KTH10022.1 heme ABC transporter [Enterobacter hormaechei subsp. hoffmannii]